MYVQLSIENSKIYINNNKVETYVNPKAFPSLT